MGVVKTMAWLTLGHGIKFKKKIYMLSSNASSLYIPHQRLEAVNISLNFVCFTLTFQWIEIEKYIQSSVVLSTKTVPISPVDIDKRPDGGRCSTDEPFKVVARGEAREVGSALYGRGKVMKHFQVLQSWEKQWAAIKATAFLPEIIFFSFQFLAKKFKKFAAKLS